MQLARLHVCGFLRVYGLSITLAHNIMDPHNLVLTLHAPTGPVVSSLPDPIQACFVNASISSGHAV